MNRFNFTITLKHNAAGSFPVNRILGPGNVDYALAPNAMVWMGYDVAREVWRVAGAQPVIRSIQRGTIAITVTSNTAVITAVDTAKAVVLWGGNSTTTDVFLPAYVVLTNATTVTATRGGNDGTTLTVAYQVLEYT